MKTSLPIFAPLFSRARPFLRPALLALGCAIVLALSQPAAHAAGPPEAMAYQGYLVDANGNPLAPTTPANYPVIFKIYATASGGASLWSEQQIVTVDKGNFSVILSEGTPYGSDPKPPLSTVVSTNGADRYIELSVIIGSAQPAPMLPRLRLLPMAYAFLATSANNLVSPAGVPVIRYANNRVEVTGDLSFSGGISGNGAGLSGLTAAQVTTGTFPDARLSGNVALRAGGNTFTGTQVINGNVAISATGIPVNFGASTGDKLSLYGASGNHYGFGIQNGQMQIHSDQIASDITFGYGQSAAMTETMRIKGTGRVGIGNPAPFRMLEIGSTSIPNSEGMIRFNSRSGTGGSNRIWDIGVPETDEVVTGTGYSFVIDDATLGTAPEFMVQWGTGNVGIGTTTPAAKLDVNGNVRATGNVTVGAGEARLAYGEATPNTLEIIGGAGIGRRVKVWAEGGASIVGRLGVGTDSPAVPLDVLGNARITMTDNGYISGQGSWIANNTVYSLVDTPARAGGEGPEIYGMSGTYGSSGGNNNASYVGSVAIRANGGYLASSMGLIVYSDRRIKRDAHPSETANDLAAIQKLRVTDYRMVDPADGGARWRKGFIAQEVEEIIPEAVSRGLEFVPDIFSLSTNVAFNATAKTLALSLTKEHGLAIGDRVRLHVDGARLEANVTAVPSAHEFVVDQFEHAPEKVFVYGKRVKDFRTVDYDRVFTTGIGAIQELAGKVQALESAQKRITQLEADASTAAVRHQQEMAVLQQEIALLKNRSPQSDQAEVLRSELNELKKAVQQLAAGRNTTKTAAVAPEPPSVVPASSDASVPRSVDAR